MRESELKDLFFFGTPCVWDPVKSIPSHDKKTKLPYQPIHSKGLNFFIFSPLEHRPVVTKCFFCSILFPPAFLTYNDTIPKTEKSN